MSARAIAAAEALLAEGGECDLGVGRGIFNSQRRVVNDMFGY